MAEKVNKLNIYTGILILVLAIPILYQSYEYSLGSNYLENIVLEVFLNFIFAIGIMCIGWRVMCNKKWAKICALILSLIALITMVVYLSATLAMVAVEGGIYLTIESLTIIGTESLLAAIALVNIILLSKTLRNSRNQ